MKQAEHPPATAGASIAAEYSLAIIDQLARIDRTCSKEEMDELVYRLLSLIGEAMQSDRVFLFERLEGTAEAYVEPFFDLSTLAERLRHDDSVMPEYPVKDGNWHLARFIVQTRGENGEAEQVLFAMRLYSEEKRREKDLMSAADAARRANEAKSEFLSCMSHDIRTLMNVIMGFTNIALQHADDPGKMKECLEKIQISGGNLQELIDDVLDISRIESGEFKIVSQPVKLPELFDFYCQAIAGMAEAKHIPIIALTANAYHEDIQKCLAAGMNAHLSKPINIDRAVRTIIECARTAKENG